MNVKIPEKIINIIHELDKRIPKSGTRARKRKRFFWMNGIVHSQNHKKYSSEIFFSAVPFEKTVMRKMKTQLKSELSNGL